MKLLFMFIVLFSVSAFSAGEQNCSIVTQTEFGATTVSVKALNARPYRRCLVFQVKSASTAYIKFGGAHSGTEGISINGASTFWQPVIIPTNSVYIRSSAGAVPVTILEGN